MPGALDQQALAGILKARERHLKTMAHLGEVEDKITPEIGAGYRDALDSLVPWAPPEPEGAGEAEA